MKKQLFILLCLGFFIMTTQAQVQTLKGTITEYGEGGSMSPVSGASVQWLGTNIGAFSDAEGRFEITRVSSVNRLIVRYITYANDTIEVPQDQETLNIVLSSANSLQGVEVSAREGSYISIKPILTQITTSEGLRRAACCNLAESFEGSLSVDVEYADAVSGAQQIAMLGLSGIYTQILLENVPYIRLLGNQFGLGFVPGSWMDAISVSKGTSSVSNGFEGITGQINLDYKKPETNKEKLFLNLYGNTMGSADVNLNTRFPMSKTKPVYGLLLLHANSQMARLDNNKDGFMDLPLTKQLNSMFRIDYRYKEVMEGRTMIGYLIEDRVGGQMKYDPKQELNMFNPYGLHIKTNKVDLITKNGFMFKDHHHRSIGTILSFNFQDNQSIFGMRLYNAEQVSGYANILYSDRFGAKENHRVGMGLSMQVDYLREILKTLQVSTSHYFQNKKEIVPGFYAEYAYSIAEKFIVMPGFRVDYHAYYNQMLYTPRLHTKWQISEHNAVRASAGKAYRVSNVIAENLSLLVSNREFIFEKDLRPEEAYNVGASYVRTFKMKGGQSTFTVDYHYTYFVNQTIVDMDQDAHNIYVYNLNGGVNGILNQSYSHAFQAELIMLPIDRFEITLAYRFNDVQMTTAGQLLQKALMSPHKALLNLNYATRYNKWKFNTTLQYNSKMRLPKLDPALVQPEQELPQYRLDAQSPDYFILNAQITRKHKQWEFYIGAENMLNYKQEMPILGYDNPFGPQFDASMLYAPITGIMGYVGMRLTLRNH